MCVVIILHIAMMKIVAMWLTCIPLRRNPLKHLVRVEEEPQMSPPSYRDPRLRGIERTIHES